MEYLLALSLTTGILCGVWMDVSSTLHLLAWAGFAGCTTFFAAGGKKDGFKTAIVTNFSGVFWAVITIQITNYLGIPHNIAISTGIITFVMCIQAKWSLFQFIPGTFVGSFSTFAAGGDWKAVIPALICGALLGWACEASGTWLHKVTNKQSSTTDKGVPENIVINENRV